MVRLSLSKIILNYMLVIALLLAAGCADDLRRRSVFDGGAGNAVIGFSVEDVSLTRDGDDRNMESFIDHAYLLFYEADSSLETGVPVAAVRADIVASDPGKLEFKMPLRLEPDTDYQLVAIANADYYVPSGFSKFGDYIDSWCKSSSDSRQSLLLRYEDRILADNVDCLPMKGSTQENSKFSFSIRNGEYKVSSILSFRRMVARIDLVNNVKNGLVVESVAICNWRDAVSVSSVESQNGNRAGTVRGVLSAEGEDTGDGIFVKMPDAGDDGIQQLKESIYCFPSMCYDSHQSDKESTAIIIKAKYKDDTESSYYRVNVGASGNRSEVKANTKYLVNIQSVKGRGASSVKEAYMSRECPIELSVVEDWDLDGSFAMDEKGNFIVLSTSRLEFDGDATESKEIKILTSKGLIPYVRYEAADDDSEYAFTSTLISESPVSTLKIGAIGKNIGEDILSGKFIISVNTPGGGTLSVDLMVVQNPSSGGMEEPVIPDGMPFALVPQSYDRVKIDHEKRTIEIDGFDPDCFNSFIDIPFKVYIKDDEDNYSSVDISTTMEWPLEGRIALDSSNVFTYCIQSFSLSGERKVMTADGQLSQDNNLGKRSISVNAQEIFYIGVGAMGPDDPAIKREIILSSYNGNNISYTITIKPRPIIIDDVVLTDKDGNSWLVLDRNIQDFKGSLLKDRFIYMKLDEHGKKHQAYNFLVLVNRLNYTDMGLTIPFKFKDEKTSFNEMQHEIYEGKAYKFTNANKLQLASNSDSEVSRLSWLRRYAYSGNQVRTSPFYEYEEGNYCYKNWIFPSEAVMELCRSKLRVSKMRTYFISDVPVHVGKINLPVCCYLPNRFEVIGDTSNLSYAYFTSSNGVNPDGLVIIYFDLEEGKLYKVTSGSSNYYGYCRLVRPLTAEELEDYKVNYLGYGSEPHRLTVCHPDTYESEPFGWLPF